MTDFGDAFRAAVLDLEKFRCPMCGRGPKVEQRQPATIFEETHALTVSFRHFETCPLSWQVKTPPP